MESKIKALREQVEQTLCAVQTKEELSAFWQQFLSKKGSIQGLMKNLGSVPAEERPAVGKVINEFKAQVSAKYDEMGQSWRRWSWRDSTRASRWISPCPPKSVLPAPCTRSPSPKIR